MKLYEVANL